MEQKNAIMLSDALNHTQEIAKIGSWAVDLINNTGKMSQVAYDIHELCSSNAIDMNKGVEYYVKEHQGIIQACLNDAIQYQKPWDVELKLITALGNEKWVRTNGRAITEDGQVVALEGTIQDIHHRKVLELERESFIERMERTEKLALIGHWQWTFNPEKIVWSKGLYDIWEYDPNSPPPSIEDHAKWIHNDDVSLFFDTLKASIATQQNYSFVFRAIFNGKIKFIRADGTAMFNENDEHIGFFGTALDITKQQVVEENLRRANDELSQFAYRTSHDLKAPLASIKGLAQVMEFDLADGNTAEVLKNISSIYQQADKLSTLVVDILELAKADIKQGDVKPFSPLLLMNEISKNLTGLREKLNVEISVDIQEKLIWRAQHVRVRQVLENLVTNGVKYSNPAAEKKWVHISAVNHELHISDNGMGIPERAKSELFTMFTRFHPSICEGSGLGMSIVKKHLDALGATISFTSSNKGTKFTITYPPQLVDG